MRDNRTGTTLIPWLLAATAVLWLLYSLSPILAPFMFATILAYICNPLVGWLEARYCPRSAGAVLTLLLLIGAFAGLVLIVAPLVQRETQLFITRIPAYLDWLKLNAAPWLQAHFGIDTVLDADKIKAFVVDHLQNAGGIAAQILPSLKSGGLALIGFIASLLLVPVVFFYVLRDWNGMLGRMETLIPRRWHARTTTIASEIDSVLSEFLRGQISVMLVMSVYYVAALHLAGLEFALPIGLVTGLLVFIPYLGMAVGLTLAILAGLMQFQGITGLLPVLIAFGIGQALEGMVVTPFLVGERIGLHPVAVIFALLAFGQLFGFFGILLALPASAALLVGMRHAKQSYLASNAYLK